MKNEDSNIKKTIKYLNNDECVAIPTETVYGLAANAYSKKAVSKIFKLIGILILLFFMSMLNFKILLETGFYFCLLI